MLPGKVKQLEDFEDTRRIREDRYFSICCDI